MLVIEVDTVASALADRVKAMLAGSANTETAAQTAAVEAPETELLEIVALVRDQVSRFTRDNTYARVAGTYDRSVIDRACEQLNAEYRGVWTVLRPYKNDHKDWSFAFQRVG